MGNLTTPLSMLLSIVIHSMDLKKFHFNFRNEYFIGRKIYYLPASGMDHFASFRNDAADAECIYHGGCHARDDTDGNCRPGL